MRPSLPRLALLLVLVLAATGCGFKRPTMRFKAVRLADVDLGGTQLDVVYSFHNPNPLGLRLAEVSYALDVEGTRVAAGCPPKGLNFAAGSSTDVVFPARVLFSAIAPVVEVFLEKDSAAYKASGTVGIETPLGVLRFPVSHQSTFPVPKIPTFQFQSPSVRNLTFSGARVIFPVQITNRNGFGLPLAGFSADINLAGHEVGTTQVPFAGAMAAGETRIVELPIDVNFLKGGSAVAQAVRSRRATVGLNGSLRSGATTVPIKVSQSVDFR